MSRDTFNPTKFNKSQNEPFASVLEKRLSRRSFVKGGAGLAALTMFSGFGLTACDNDDSESDTIDQAIKSLGFESISGSLTDAVVVAAGYTAQVLAPWGTPLNSNAAEWKSDGSNTAEDQANSVGMHHDGMCFFPLNGSSTDGLLCINHEYIDQSALHPEGVEDNAEKFRKEMNAHGVSVIRVQLTNGQWDVVKDDAHNRRFTAATEFGLSGPIASTDLLVTAFAPNGDVARGTLNNCGNGFTPWGTYLTCEENWPEYFVNTGELDASQTRIGVGTTAGRYGWEAAAGDASEVDDEFARFNVTPTGATAADDYRNEMNGYGYIVEIDPYNPASTAMKRTALGRFRHEGCAIGKLEEGKPLSFYSGHDSRFEYLYKFVSAAVWDAADANPADRMATGAKYMDEGTLYVARFDADGAGVWLPLTLDSATTDGGTLADSFASLAEILLNTPGAADLVGATPMDRPEWTAVDPITGTVYLTLTNNTRRTEANAANPRINNAFGHIIRWDDDATGTGFSWDIFVFGSPADADADINVSGLDTLNQFASPDGLVFDERGIMWVQTDNGADEVTSYTNDQMLAIIPSNLKNESGEYTTLSADNQAELKRFFVGPNGCEVTGLAMTADYSSFFANIQHPGNWPYATDATVVTPEGETIRPRAATVVIRKAGGGAVGE